jgi:hypothetical protein
MHTFAAEKENTTNMTRVASAYFVLKFASSKRMVFRTFEFPEIKAKSQYAV